MSRFRCLAAVSCLIFLADGHTGSEEECSALSSPSSGEFSCKDSKMKAVVLGATGAVGRELVSQLVDSGRWSAVTTIGT